MRRESPAREPGDGEGPQSAKALARVGPFMRPPTQGAAVRRPNGPAGEFDQALGSPSWKLELGSPLPPLNIPSLNSPPLFHPSPRRSMMQSPARPAHHQPRANNTAAPAAAMDAFEALMPSQSPAYSKLMMMFSPTALGGSSNIFDTPTHRGLLALPADLATPTPRRGMHYDPLATFIPGAQAASQHHQHHQQSDQHVGHAAEQQRALGATERPAIGSGGSAAGQAKASDIGSEQPTAVPPSGTPRDALLQAFAGGVLSPDYGLGHHSLGLLHGFPALDAATAGALHADAMSLDVQHLNVRDMLLGNDDDALTPSPHLGIALGGNHHHHAGGAATGNNQRNRILDFGRTPRFQNGAAASAGCFGDGGGGGGGGMLGRPGPGGYQLPQIPLLPMLPPLPAPGSGQAEGMGPGEDKMQQQGFGSNGMPSAEEHTAAREVVIKTEPGVATRTRNESPDGPGPTGPHGPSAAGANGNPSNPNHHLHHHHPGDTGPSGGLGMVPSLSDPMYLMSGLGPLSGGGPPCGDAGFVDFAEALVSQRGMGYPLPHGGEARHTPGGGGGGGGGLVPLDPPLSMQHPARGAVGTRQGGAGGGAPVGERPGLPPRGAGLGPGTMFAINGGAGGAGGGASSTPSTQQRPQRAKAASQLYGGGGAAAASEGLRRMSSMDPDGLDNAVDGPGFGRRLSGTGSGAANNKGRRTSDGAAPPTQNKSCKCKKSQCLKLYCDCFAVREYCGACSCVNCHNRPEYAEKVKQRREDIVARDPQAFTRKIQHAPNGNGKHKRGCNCRRSHCLKKYCECYQGGVKCGMQCTCLECENMDVVAPSGGRATGKRGAASKRTGTAAGRANSSSAAAGDDSALSPPLPSTSGCSDGPSPAHSLETVQGMSLSLQMSAGGPLGGMGGGPGGPHNPYNFVTSAACGGSGAGGMSGAMLGQPHAGAPGSRPFPMPPPHLQQQPMGSGLQGMMAGMASFEQGQVGAGGLARSSSFPLFGAAAGAGPDGSGMSLPQQQQQQNLHGAASEPLTLLSLPMQPHHNQPSQQQPPQYGQGQPSGSPSLGPIQTQQGANGVSGAGGATAAATEGGAESGPHEAATGGGGGRAEAEASRGGVKTEVDGSGASLGQVGSAERGRTSLSSAEDVVMHSANGSNECPAPAGTQPQSTTTGTGPHPTAEGGTAAAAAAPPPASSAKSPELPSGQGAEQQHEMAPPGTLHPQQQQAEQQHRKQGQAPHQQREPPPFPAFLRGTPRSRDLGMEVVSPPALCDILANPLGLDSDSDGDGDELGLRKHIRRDVRQRRDTGGGGQQDGPARTVSAGLAAAAAGMSLGEGGRGHPPHDHHRQGDMRPRGSIHHHHHHGMDGMGLDFGSIADEMVAAIAGAAAGGGGGGSARGRPCPLPDGAQQQGPGGGGLLCGERLPDSLLPDTGPDALYLPPSEPNSIEGLRSGGSRLDGTNMLNDAVAKAAANAFARREAASFLGPDAFLGPSAASAAAAAAAGGPGGGGSWGHPPLTKSMSCMAMGRPGGTGGGDMLSYDSGLQSWPTVGGGGGGGGAGCSGSPTDGLSGDGRALSALRGPAAASSRGMTGTGTGAGVHTLVPRVRTDFSKRRCSDVGLEGGTVPMQIGNDPDRENWGTMYASSPKHRFVPAPAAVGASAGAAQANTAITSHLPLQPLQQMGGSGGPQLSGPQSSYNLPYMPYGEGPGGAMMDGGGQHNQQQPQRVTGGTGGRGGGGSRGGRGGGRGARNAAAEKEALKAAALEKAVAWQYISQRLGNSGAGPRAQQPDSLEGGAGAGIMMPGGSLGAPLGGPPFGLVGAAGSGLQPLSRPGSIGAGLAGLAVPPQHLLQGPQQQQQVPLSAAGTGAPLGGASGGSQSTGLHQHQPPQQQQQQQEQHQQGKAASLRAGGGKGGGGGDGPAGEPPGWNMRSPPEGASGSGGRREGAATVGARALGAGGPGGGPPGLATPASANGGGGTGGGGGGLQPIRMGPMTKLGSGSTMFFSPNSQQQQQHHGNPRGS